VRLPLLKRHPSDAERFWGNLSTPAAPAWAAPTLEATVRDHRYLDTALGQDAEDFLTYLDPRRSANTVNGYRYALALGCVLYPELGIGDFTESHIERILMQVPAGSRNQVKSAWSSFFSWAYRNRRVDANPVQRVEPLPRKRRRNHEIFTNEEVDRLLALPIRDGALHALLLEGGFRIGEAATIQGRHVDFRNGTVAVTGKGDKDRIVPMPPRAMQLVAELFTLEGINDDDFLWYGRRGGRNMPEAKVTRHKPIDTKYTMHQWWARTLAQAGVPYIPRSERGTVKGRNNPHTSRHTYAMRWLRGEWGCAAHEVPPEDERELGAMEILQKLLGHSSIATTEAEYGRLELSDVKRAMRRMAGAQR
jgi:integrase